MPRAFFRRVLLAAGATILFLLSLEGVLVLLGIPSQGLYEGNRVTDWRLKANLSEQVLHSSTGATFGVETSSRGFRDEEWGPSGPGIVALGCSTTFGWGVEASDAWPEQLEALLERPVLNAAVPGQSTHQGIRVALELIEEEPEGLILGWIVRDAQRASRADKDAKAPSGLRKTRLFRWLSGGLSSGAKDSFEQGVSYRVSPEDYSRNLQVVLERASARGIPVWLFAFPSQKPLDEHLEAIRGLDAPVLEPSLPSSAFFPQDPIHLTPAGHLQLAEQLFASMKGGSVEGASPSVEDDSARLE